LEELVPAVEEVAGQEMAVYVADDCIPGTTGLKVKGRWEMGMHVRSCFSLGRILGRKFCDDISAQVVDMFLVPKLCDILMVTRGDSIVEVHRLPYVAHRPGRSSRPAPSVCDALLSQLDETHGVERKWGHRDSRLGYELRSIFGIGCKHALFLGGEFRRDMYHQQPGFEQFERAFWDMVMDSAPSEVVGNPEAMQVAALIGHILGKFEGENIISTIVLAALPTLIKYRIPAIREYRKHSGLIGSITLLLLQELIYCR